MKNLMIMKLAIALLILVVLFYFGAYKLIWQWGVCRRYCNPSKESKAGESLLVIARTGKQTEETNRYALPGERGVREQLVGPGRHFFNPFLYEVRVVKDLLLEPGQIAYVKNKLGKDLPPDRFLADEGEKGILKRVFTPGCWRINPQGQEYKVVDATFIPPGYVGVQTLQTGSDKGVLKKVLHAGYYAINPKEINVRSVGVGYYAIEISADYEWVQQDGQKVMKLKSGTGVSFPLADGKIMTLDLTFVICVYPEDTPRLIGEYGDIEQIKERVIIPNVTSFCKNFGSNLTTQQFIVGKSREEFQNKLTDTLKEIGKEKGIHIFLALIRGFHPSEDIAAAIQAREIAELEKTTLKEEEETARIFAELEQAKKKVDVAVADFEAETIALEQGILVEGDKQQAQIQTEADRKVAELQKQSSEITAQATKILGKADADVIEMLKKAEATEFEYQIKALGSEEAYRITNFANSLPEDIQIIYRYSGPGTLWTDPGADLSNLAAKKILEEKTDAEESETAKEKPKKLNNDE